MAALSMELLQNLPVQYCILIQKLALMRWVATQEANYSKNENEGAQTMNVNDLGQVTHGRNLLWD